MADWRYIVDNLRSYVLEILPDSVWLAQSKTYIVVLE